MSSVWYSPMQVCRPNLDHRSCYLNIFAAFLNRKYAKLFVENLSVSVTAALHTYSDCEHILMNFLVSLVSKKPPLKVTHRRKFQVVSSSKNHTQMSEEFSQKQTCINIFFSGFGQMPLIKSKLRLDPVLFKDPVSNLRKKFRKIELAQWGECDITDVLMLIFLYRLLNTLYHDYLFPQITLHTNKLICAISIPHSLPFCTN